MKEIFFDKKLGETQRNSEGCEPCGQGVGAVGGMGAVGVVGAVGIAPEPPKGD